MTGRLTDGQLFVAAMLVFLAAEAGLAAVWRHHKQHRRRTRAAHHWPYDWRQDDPHLAVRSHVRLISGPRSTPPASGLHQDTP